MKNELEAVDANKVHNIKSAEELLSYLRKGNSQKIEIGIDGWKVPCRLLSAKEMINISIIASESAKRNNPTGKKAEQFEAIEAMIKVIDRATTIEGAPYFAAGFLESLPEPVLSNLYDQYMTINNAINPDIQVMSVEIIQKIIEEVKKKQKTPKDYFTWELAEIGKFFLAEIVPNLPTDKEPGSI